MVGVCFLVRCCRLVMMRDRGGEVGVLVIFDGTTLDLFACPELAAEFGVPEGGTHPKLRVVALLQAGTMRWKAAALGGYHDGENALADQLEGALGPVSSASIPRLAAR
jgi:hypothetical protein